MNVDLNALAGEEAFEKSFPEAELLEPGKYNLAIRGKQIVAKRGKSGNVYLTVAAAATSDLEGNTVRSGLIYHMIPFEGTNSKGVANINQFATFFTSLGLDPDQVRALATSVVEQVSGLDLVAGDRDSKAELSLSINGEPYSITGSTFAGTIKVDEYNGKSSNKIGSTWAIDS